MKLINVIESVLKIEVHVGAHRSYTTSRPITEEDCVALINSGNGFEWQDADSHDCGLSDGGLYMYCNNDYEGESFFVFLSEGNELSIC